MEKVNLASLTLDDIVFEHRNRAYGAYELRASYERNMTRAITLAPLLLLLLVGGPMVVSNLIKSFIPVEILDPVVCGLISPPNVLQDIEIIPEKRPSLPPAPRANTVRYRPLEPVPDHTLVKHETLATTDMLENAIAGPLTIDGIGDEIPVIDITEGTGEGTGAPVEAVAPPTEFLVVEEMPEFPGGQAAMLKYIGKHLRYPASAQAKGIAGIVYVSFVISPEGQVTQVAVMKGIDTACDQEAARVISKMPTWKPGRQSGRNVPVRYSLPIRFSMP
ncbi:MAG: energy transducer TonB [Cytophagales bacterium]|nr:energy transducer TonB [Cytophagales bacterium]